jgi:multicomponent Na+:H+ antiporter subunit A
MDVLAAVLSGFALAILAPAVHRVAGKATGWLLALHPAALVAYFAWLAPAIWRDGPRVVRVEWAPALGLDLTFRLDGFSILFFILIAGLGAIILIYGGGYLEKSPRLPRFYPLLLFFMASMLGVVVADNLVLIYIFWELTSVSSYLLIGFEYERESARAAALKALLVTATGGVLMLGGFVILGIIGGSFELSVLFQQEDFIRNHELYTFATLLVIAGAFTKSAQFPFQFWLPAAMEAPTPVSAYLHAATMVKAGVYLLARLNPLLGGTDLWAGCLITAGLITLLFGALLSLYGTDLKQVLAFLTVSVLGVLTFLIGLGTEIAVKAMVIYLTAHALYKGALFLVAGAVDHETGTRDIRDLGGLRGKLPITAAAGAMAAIALAGLPPMYGFIAKEMLYEAGTHAPFLAALFTSALVLSAMFYFAAAGIVGYSPFFGTKKETPKHPHEAPPSMWLGPLVLASAGLVLGIRRRRDRPRTRRCLRPPSLSRHHARTVAEHRVRSGRIPALYGLLAFGGIPPFPGEHVPAGPFPRL